MYACQSAFTKAILSRVAWLILAIGLIHTAWGQAFPLPEPLVVDRPLTTLLAQERMVVYTGTITTPYAFLAALKAPSGEIKTGEAMSEPAYRCPEAWICIPLVNTTDELQKMVMNLDHNRCDTLEAWVGRKDSLSLRYVGKLDRGMPLGQRAIPLRDFALPFELAPHDSLLLLLRSRRTTGVHELNPVVSTEKAFMINHEKEEVIRLLALASVFFFMFTVFSLGVIFRHRLLICFGVYMFPIALGQLNYNYFFDAFPFPARLSLTANSIGLFIIFMANALFHSFGTEYIRSLGIYQTGHRYAIRTLVVANLIPMGLLLVPLRPPLQAFVTAASLLLTTLNILWLFYISVLGFIEKREKYLFITSTLIFVPVLYKTYLATRRS
ncbi:hypothetical protein BWI93_03915 [Siphonobacter sp. BAB-5385]|uniref:7TM-DISM domain-containing protein n=1 Tax=Siphonobacter sp. BAB-5385 TaxID=1864822 RepID=UPI000B9E0FCD|nr:hypothetical protein [Siphonobacter sp. BAB-5385]OZI09461.1 hypothetical protein BWI93_03915 [Siphonobacter sp. BAB-5385]